MQASSTPYNPVPQNKSVKSFTAIEIYSRAIKTYFKSSNGIFLSGEQFELKDAVKLLNNENNTDMSLEQWKDMIEYLDMKQCNKEMLIIDVPSHTEMVESYNELKDDMSWDVAQSYIYVIKMLRPIDE